MTTLLIADHDGLMLSDQTANAVTAARAIGSDVHVLVAGENTAAIAEAAARFDGIALVKTADDPSLAHQLAEPMASLILSLADDYETIIAPATSNGKNYMPRVAAALDVMQVSEICEVVAPDTFKRPIYAGNAIQTIQAIDGKRVVTVRSASFDAASTTDKAAPIETVSAPADPAQSRFVSSKLSGGERPELTSARTIISGGRALGSRESFERVIMPVADKLGAAVGASRAAVDSGYAPNDWQVGQTGKVVAPDLYIACGISGAIQHLAGMSDSKVIVVINKDEDAPIFQVADYGLVADLFEALPELEKAL